MSEELRSATLGGFVDAMVTYKLSELRVSTPGVVESYDAAKNTAVVQVSIKRIMRTIEGSRVEEVPVPLPDVPVLQLRSSLGYLTIAPKKGDRVAVFFADDHLGTWSASQGTEPVDPAVIMPHSFSNAFAIVGLYPAADALSPAPSTEHVVLASLGSAKVLLGANDESGMQFVALAQKVLDELNKIKDAFNGHTHNVVFGACTAGGTTGTAPTSAGPIYTPASVAAERVKAK